MKRKADIMVQKVTKRVRITSDPINLEVELAHASSLLEGIRDEAVEAVEWVRAVDTRIRDVEGWVRDLWKRAKEAK